MYLQFQQADRALEELIEQLDMGRVRKFANFIRVRLEERCPFMNSSQAWQIHDFGMLMKGGDWWRIIFSKDHVCKAAFLPEGILPVGENDTSAGHLRRLTRIPHGIYKHLTLNMERAFSVMVRIKSKSRNNTPRTTSSPVCGRCCRPLLNEMWSTQIGFNSRLAVKSSSKQWSETAMDNL